MGFKNFEIKPNKTEIKPNKPDDYDLAKKDLEKDTEEERDKESNSEHIPDEIKKKIKEIYSKEEMERIISEAEKQGERESGILGTFLEKITDEMKKRTGALVLSFMLFNTGMAFAKVNEAEARGGRRGDNVGDALGGAVARGVEDFLGGIFGALGRKAEELVLRKGSGKTPEETEREVRETQREDDDFHEKYLEISDDYEKGRITEDQYNDFLAKLNTSHSLRHRYNEDKKDGDETQIRSVPGCRFPDGFVAKVRPNF